MISFSLSSGLFLGWSLGANDTANIFGTAVATRMVRFSVAAAITVVFVILGSVISGAGAAQTLGALGSVNALAGAFTVALAAAVAVTWMTWLGLPVSTSQAIVGAIIGWNIFTGAPTDPKILGLIVSTWFSSLFLSALFALILFKLFKYFLDRAKIHLLRLDHYNRLLLIAAGAFGAYTLGANNIANVMGVFVPIEIFESSTYLGFLHVTGVQKLFFLGALSIGVGVVTYAKKVIYTVGNDICKLTPITALIVVIAQSLVLFLFSSQQIESWLIIRGLPSFPLVPVSSSQAVVGAIIGIGIAKAGGRGINFRILGKITLGWLATPALAILLCLLTLFFVQNVFEQAVAKPESYEISPAVTAALEKEHIPVDPLRTLSKKTYHSSESFRENLMLVYKWNQKELFKIFYYARVEEIMVDADILHSRFNIKYFTPEELAAVKKLDGRTFTRHWQFHEALAGLSPAWRPREEIKQNKPFNDQLKQKREILRSIFRKKTPTRGL